MKYLFEEFQQMNEGVTTKKELYSWGAIRIISKGMDFSIVIHPEDWEGIENLLDGTYEDYSFYDETGVSWSVEKVQGATVWQAHGMYVEVPDRMLYKIK